MMTNWFEIRRPINEWLLTVLIAFLVSGSLISFFLLVEPALHQQSPYRLWADSQFYLWMAGLAPANPYGIDSGEIPGLLSVGANLLGPMLIAKVLRQDTLILLFNYVLLLVAIHYCRKGRRLNTPLFTFLLLINPVTITSLLAINKEILSILSAAMLCCYVERERRSKFLLCALLTIALLARWEQMILTVLFLTLTNKRSPLSKRPIGILVLVIAGVTVLYPLMANSVTQLAFGDQGAQGHTVAMLTSMQAHYLYFVAAIPKAILGLVGTIVVFVRPSDLPSTDVYNLVLMPISALLNLFVIAWAAIAGKIRLSDDITLFACLCAFMFTIPPIALVRYLIPVYMVAALLVATPAPVRFGSLECDKRQSFRRQEPSESFS